jgi:transposase
MRDSDDRKLDHRTLEQLRIRAVGQVEQGAHPDEVAAGLGMTRAAIYAWLAKYREGGLDAMPLRYGYGGGRARRMATAWVGGLVGWGQWR